MSWIADVILTINFRERFDDDFNDLKKCEIIDHINAWLEKHEFGKLDELSLHVTSGGEPMGSLLYGGAFNFLKIDDFIALVLSQP